MANGTLRTIQPAHKGGNITVRQAKEAWRQVEKGREGAGKQGPARSQKSARK